MGGLTFEQQRAASVGELRVDWDPADLSRGRALRIRGKERTCTYVERGGKRRHELVRPGARVHMTRSSGRNPSTISGTWTGDADALEGVYTRNLSLSGASVSLPGRFLNRFNDL
ncbi:hypothetical protein [Streptomyces massasporeus]|uniref:hypothetical protein n=1 Tax=Streptomyces massasporeus TaxID=67324 RepID=UPI0036CF76DD